MTVVHCLENEIVTGDQGQAFGQPSVGSLAPCRRCWERLDSIVGYTGDIQPMSGFGVRFSQVNPSRQCPVFILHGEGFGAPDRMKLGTLMSLFARNNFAH